ncbi:hypothetical protein C1646_624208 [Rhizophagus diaphanus]|nr:hypothetical protein C1646_624208 [Rhizophagus diaphanus] [Rhizophagus sp. MUCL 43196]
MSWSKKNLFIIHQRGDRLPRSQNRTLFQQKWQAKKDTRAYHGAQLNEQQFRRLFEPKLPTSNIKVQKEEQHPPVSVLTYASLERRLDFIVFRSCFASSIWAARQIIIHGKVSVNGKKVSVPSQLAKDGDIISIDPHAVPYLTEPMTPKGLTFKPIPYMQPFLFIPEYLEVNFNTCSIVFLRNPISRPGRSEIPSPFPPEIHSLAHEYYAERIKKKKSKRTRRLIPVEENFRID